MDVIMTTFRKKAEPLAACAKIPARPLQTREAPEETLAQLAGVIQRGMRAADRQIISQVFQGASLEDLCAASGKSPEQVQTELANVRWRFRDLIQRHGFDKSSEPKVQSFIKKIQSLLSR